MERFSHDERVGSASQAEHSYQLDREGDLAWPCIKVGVINFQDS